MKKQMKLVVEEWKKKPNTIHIVRCVALLSPQTRLELWSKMTLSLISMAGVSPICPFTSVVIAGRRLKYIPLQEWNGRCLKARRWNAWMRRVSGDDHPLCLYIVQNKQIVQTKQTQQQDCILYKQGCTNRWYQCQVIEHARKFRVQRVGKCSPYQTRRLRNAAVSTVMEWCIAVWRVARYHNEILDTNGVSPRKREGVDASITMPHNCNLLYMRKTIQYAD